MREALGFLTVLGGATTPTPRALRWFPVVGLGVGALVGAVWLVAGELLLLFPAAVAAVAADLAVTGMLHVDGLADAGDGLLPHADRERRLRIMREPGVGAYGVAIVTVVLVARVAGFTALAPDVALVAALWCASRTVIALAPSSLPYARDEGLATALVATPATR
ncbi:MAG TPA: adenosylcobinamide-GDP ribazoletransferase, partial [Acidimicrobiia bacterium]